MLVWEMVMHSHKVTIFFKHVVCVSIMELDIIVCVCCSTASPTEHVCTCICCLLCKANNAFVRVHRHTLLAYLR